MCLYLSSLNPRKCVIAMISCSVVVQLNSSPKSEKTTSSPTTTTVTLVVFVCYVNLSLPWYIENDSFAPLCISQLGLSPLLLAGMHCIEHMVFTGSCAALYKKHSKRNNSRTTSTSSQFNDRSPVLSVEWTDGDSPRYT